MEKMAFAASCALSAHYALLIYMLLSGSADLTLLKMIYLTGVLAILMFCATRYPYNHPICASNVVLAGITTFYSTLLMRAAVYVSIFKWLIGYYYYMGALRTAYRGFVDPKTAYIKSFIYSTITMLINVLYSLGVLPVHA